MSQLGGDFVSSKLFGVIPRRTIDDPNAAETRIEIDKFLRHIYTHQLQIIRNLTEAKISGGTILEIGAAGGITKLVWPEVITTDVREAAGVDKIMSAERLDFEKNSLSCIFGMDALHHVPDPEAHFREVDRCLVSGGVAVYIEPNWNFFSKFAFGIALKYLHPEPYDLNSTGWALPGDDPMMGNQAQGHNIFARDKMLFSEKFPRLQIEILQSVKGLSFLISGGVHTRLPIPSRILVPIYNLENRSERWIKSFGLGRVIRVTKA